MPDTMRKKKNEQRGSAKVNRPTNTAWSAPDRAGFEDPFNRHRLLAYYEQLRLAHGYIRFVSLPHFEDRPDVPIDRLYVLPELSERYARADRPPQEWPPRQSLLSTVAAHPRLVVLGDPGSGKSTLVSWIAYELSRSAKSAYCQQLGPLVPLPLVVRDLGIGPDIDWHSLLAKFSQQEFQRVAEAGAGHLTAEELEDLLVRGQALVMLDGLDEIASVSVRKALRRAIWQGMDQYPQCRFLLTSRIVGYDDVPFDHEGHAIVDPLGLLAGLDHAKDEPNKGSSADQLERSGAVKNRASTAYLAPFGDSQIEQFSHVWYERYASESGATGDARAQDLVTAVHANEGTLKLARVPVLLTFIALIHRIEAQLPYGRVRLYRKIVDAYLESIDSYRGLQEVGYTLEEKKRWLAQVGFLMQQRRAETEADPNPFMKPDGAREILADEADLVAWLASAMERSPTAGTGTGDHEGAARTFVDYIARRSGLLLPRGQGQFAFAHLSIQEYFAAEHLLARLRSPRWLGQGKNDSGDGPEDLRGYAESASWRETLVLLFGLLAGDPEWSQVLADELFGEAFSRLEDDEELQHRGLALLLADVSVDPHGGLPGPSREKAWAACWSWELDRINDEAELRSQPALVAGTLLAAVEQERPVVMSIFEAGDEGIGPSKLCLDNTRITNLEPIKYLVNLQRLSLMYTQITDLKPLENLTNLQELYLGSTQITDLKPLENLTNLQELYLGSTQASDLKPLENLTQLRILDLESTQVTDLKPLENLTQLTTLSLDNTQVSDLTSLEKLTNLTTLYLDNTHARVPAGLRKRRTLHISDGRA